MGAIMIDEAVAARGQLVIAGEREEGRGAGFFAPAHARGAPEFRSADRGQLDRACAAAAAAFDAFKDSAPEERAAFLDAIAANLLALGETLIASVVAETGLPRGRAESERDRTAGQLRLFARLLRDGRFLDARIDPALPDRKPVPRPDLRMRKVAVGPVAVFGASNFPLAFSVAGGDTASALAAGCPVICKAHPAHPATSELAALAIADAAAATGMPRGVFSMLADAGHAIGQALVADPRIQAVGFTGSRAGGTALMKIAAARPTPIPVFAEMSSINPVIILPGALAERGGAIGASFVASLTLGAGQFCTSPGLVLLIEGDGHDAFRSAAANAIAAAPAAAMLTPAILRGYEAGVAALRGHRHVTVVATGAAGAEMASPALFETTAGALGRHAELAEEVFGAASLIVRCRDEPQLIDALEALEGQLTIAMHLDARDLPQARALLPILERKAGRIVVNGFGTGVEVGHAMVHGGPYPATSDGRSTSVGAMAIERFLRPIAYQGFPAELLPPALAEGNPWQLPRAIDGGAAATA
jgi:2,5-dioxopentanoate dehydrogenase